ncbi:hypothetical protein GW17_00028735 [Ensete ventricosum]|nr:hypothetical protein GW17_00028735 [Ensete ventricosum]
MEPSHIRIFAGFERAGERSLRERNVYVYIRTQMLDPHIAAWVAEFVLRQPVEDWLAHEIFFLLPLPSPPPLCLRRTILLRRLASDLTLTC